MSALPLAGDESLFVCLFLVVREFELRAFSLLRWVLYHLSNASSPGDRSLER
jgi:hypothetical protein